MDGKIPIKVYLEDAEYFKEIRRIDLDKATATDVEALKARIMEAFPLLQCRKNIRFSLAWEDAEGDLIAATTDEELRLGLEEFRQTCQGEDDMKRLKIHLTWGARFHFMRSTRGVVLAAVGTVFSGLVSDVLHRAVTALIGFNVDY